MKDAGLSAFDGGNLTNALAILTEKRMDMFQSSQDFIISEQLSFKMTQEDVLFHT